MCNCASDALLTPQRLLFTISEWKGFFVSMLPSISSRRSLKISLTRNERRELPPFFRLITARCHLWKMVQSDSINEIDCRFFTIRTVCEYTQRPTARRHILPSQSRAKQNLATINYACFLIFQVEHKLNWSFVRFIFIARLFSVPSLSTSFFLPIEIIEFVNFFISHNSSSFFSQMACTKHNKHNKSIFDVFSSTLLFVFSIFSVLAEAKDITCDKK